MKRAGLVLEGGANRGVFTSGALDYLMEQDFISRMWLELPRVRAMRWIMCQGSHCAQRNVPLLRIRRSVM